jgi:hypothetical protein
MKRFGSYFAAGIFLLLASFAFAQDPAPEPKPPQHDEARPEDREAPRATQPKQDEAKPPKQEQEKQEKDREKEKQEATRPPQDEARPAEGRPMEHPQDHQAQGRDDHARPSGKSAHIPDDKFHASFGRQHTFVVSRPVIVEGQPRFQYSGYWFTIVDPWPSEWLYTDDVYVDYIDGEYFLFDLLHPGLRVAVFVVM